MARLKQLAPRAPAAAPRVAVASGHDRDRVRDKIMPGRAWYHTKEWRALRLAVLKRDHWTCRQTGVPLVGKYPAPNSPAIDHITPHRNNRELFFSIDNCQAVSKAWHDSVKQKIERAGDG